MSVCFKCFALGCGLLAFFYAMNTWRSVVFARTVKLLDLDDNLDVHRLVRLPREDRERLNAKYGAARLAILQAVRS